MIARSQDGNDLAVGALPHRRVGAQQVMIDDDDVGVGGALPHARDEAVVVARTLGADAVFGAGGDVVPERRVLRQILELGAVAGLGARRDHSSIILIDWVSSKVRIAPLSRHASKRCRQR